MNSSLPPENALQYSLTIPELVEFNINSQYTPGTIKWGKATYYVVFFSVIFVLLGILGSLPVIQNVALSLIISIAVTWSFIRFFFHSIRKQTADQLRPIEEHGDLNHHTVQISHEGLIEDTVNRRIIYRWNNEFEITTIEGKHTAISISVGKTSIGFILIPEKGIEAGDYLRFLNNLHEAIAHPEIIT